MVFLNGVLMTGQSWVLQTRELERRYRCILHDFRGQMLSAKPPGPYSMELHAEDLRALLDALDVEGCHLVGTSYGGEVGMVFAYTYPERVRSLTVISSVSHVEVPLRRQIERWRQAALEDPGSLYDLSAPDNFSPRFRKQYGGVIAQGRRRLEQSPPEFFRALVGLIDAFEGLDVTARLPEIRCPTLVMCGEGDTLKPVAYSRTIASAIPYAEMLVVPGAGHAVVIEKHREVNTALLGFLAKHADASSSRRDGTG